MKTPIALLLMTSLILASCGWRDSRVNPRNWFGEARSTQVPAEAAEDGTPVNPLVPRARRGVFQRPEAEDRSQPIARVTALRVERTSTGAIISATGIAARQGAFNSELRRDPDAPEGTLSYTFRVVYPKDATPVGSDLTRTIQDAVSLTHQDLAGIRTIRVSGAENAQQTRRR